MRTRVSWAAAMLILVTALSARAAPKIGNFWAGAEGTKSQTWNTGFFGGGDGYTTVTGGNPWFAYDWRPGDPEQTNPWGDSNPQPGWYNQWWYDDPYDPTRTKIVRLVFKWDVNNKEDPWGGGANVIINYSLPGWDNVAGHENHPPLPGADEQYIGRVQVARLWSHTFGPFDYDQTFNLRDEYQIPYNPEWVSVDVVGFNFLISAQGQPGQIYHECVPEPGLLLPALGLGLLALWRRRS